MDLTDIKQLILNFAPLPEEEVDFFLKKLQIVEVAKGEDFSSPGHDVNRIAFVKAGAFKSFRINEEGIEFIDVFMKTGDFIGDYSAIVKNQPTERYIRALNNSQVIVSPFNISAELHARNPLWYLVGLRIAEKLNLKQQDRIEQLTLLKTIERYHSFCREHEGILDLIPQMDIASYLGVTAASLSRLLKGHRT